MAWIYFGALLCRKKKLITARGSVLLKSRTSPDMLPFSLCNKKRLAIRHMNRPLFPMTLSIPSYYKGKYVGLRTYQHPLVYPSLVFSCLQVPQQEFCTAICMPFLNATFSTPPIMIYVVKSTNYESYRYAVCLPSCLFLSCLSVLHYTIHITSLIYWHFSQFMYFVYKRVCTSCGALTVVLLGIQVCQDVTQCCLDLLTDKYLHCGERAAQIMHNLRWARYSVLLVFHNSNLTKLGTVYCACIHLFMICEYLSPWHEMSSGCRWRRGLPDIRGRCQYTE